MSTDNPAAAWTIAPLGPTTITIPPSLLALPGAPTANGKPPFESLRITAAQEGTFVQTGAGARVELQPGETLELAVLARPSFTYKGYEGRFNNGKHHVLVRLDGEVLGLLDPRFDIRRHSPTGFAWGYEGSGAAQLALAIVMHHVTHAPEDRALLARIAELPAVCPLCADSGSLEGPSLEGPCRLCGIAALVQRTYQRYKSYVIASLPQVRDFSLSTADVHGALAQIASMFPELVAPCEAQGATE